MKRVLVTGATGFVGRSVIVALKREGWTVTNGTRSMVNGTELDCVYIDLENPTSILLLEKTHVFDAIVHLGARVGWSNETIDELFTSNVLSTGCLSYLAKRWKCQIVFASAAIVHGVKNVAMAANAPICCDTPYGKSKWLAELMLEASSAHHCILRLGGIFGKAGPEHLGFNRAISRALKGEAPELVGLGNARRNYIYVKDVAEAIIFVLNKRLAGTHLLAGSKTMSIADMLQEICNVFIPGKQPLLKNGAESSDQIIQSSSTLPPTRSIRQALMDIKENSN